MFLAVPSRQKSPLRWATPLLFAVLWGCFTGLSLLPELRQQELVLQWGALSGGLGERWQWLGDGISLRLVSALFLHADWAHLLGNLVFLLIFGLPAERAIGP
ncbi:MAG: rhomboid family intramembrane serine protease, partial [Pseudomonadota bacterium]|nr:rhomboid family intramembrane serine protease [Pseudomonadota bacterium]